MKNRHKPTYLSWRGMRNRCRYTGNKDYHNYGGRGISVCSEWENSFEQFLSDMGERPDGMTLDRINPDGNYAPENCRWATVAQQNRNQRNQRDCLLIDSDGKAVHVKAGYLREFCRRHGLNQGNLSHVLSGRKNHHGGWSAQYLDEVNIPIVRDVPVVEEE